MIARICSLLKIKQPLLNRGFLFASGTTVPTDGTDGYQVGCLFQKTDGGASTAAYINEGSVTSSAFKAVESGDYGAFASVLAGSGIAISSSNTSALAAYSDDAGSNIAASVRGVQSRFLLTTDASGSSIRALQGQLKLADGVDVTTGIYTAVQGYAELAGDTDVQTGATFSCFDASLEIASGKTLTVDSGGEACGIHVETTGAGTISNAGTCAGVLIDKASGAPDWPMGISVLNSTVGVNVGSAVTGIDFSGTYTGNAMDFSDATIDPSGSGGPCFIRMGTYGSEIDYGADNDQSGAIRIYTTCSGASSYDRGVFVCTVTTGAKAAFPIAGLAEANNTGTGPSNLGAGQFIAMLGARSSGANLATLGGGANLLVGMYGIWAKVGAASTSVRDSGSRAAAIWCDNQMSGTGNGEEFGIFATTGASRPDAFIGFSTNSSGYSQLFNFDSTFDSGAGTCVTTDAVPGTQDARALVWYDGLQYYVALYR